MTLKRIILFDKQIRSMIFNWSCQQVKIILLFPFRTTPMYWDTFISSIEKHLINQQTRATIQL